MNDQAYLVWTWIEFSALPEVNVSHYLALFQTESPDIYFRDKLKAKCLAEELCVNDLNEFYFVSDYNDCVHQFGLEQNGQGLFF